MTPIRFIQNRIDMFRQSHFSNEMIGVHARMGDKFGMNTNSETMIRKAILAVDQHLESRSSAKIFLCTDDGAPYPDGRPTVTHGVHAVFTQRYGDRVARTIPRSMKRWEPESIQDALVDLMLLRSVHCLVDTADSMFSEIAGLSTACIERTMVKVDSPPMTLLRRTARALNLHTPVSAFTKRHPSWRRILVAMKTLTVRLNRRKTIGKDSGPNL